jgi:hypothetical protein
MLQTDATTYDKVAGDVLGNSVLNLMNAGAVPTGAFDLS